MAEEAETLNTPFSFLGIYLVFAFEKQLWKFMYWLQQEEIIHVQVGMVRIPLWQLFFYFLMIRSVQDTTKN